MEDNQLEPMEVLSPSAVHALERAAIDTQVATAHQYPRSLEKFKKRALEMATLDEDTAESCIYCRPVGKEKDEKTGKWKEKIVEGPSIRLAEIVGCSYGNLRVASRIVEQTPRFVKCEGVCHDLESNYAGKSEIMESTVNKDGIPYSERMRAVTAKVALAKAYRDAIFKVVPRALCKPVAEAAKKVAKGTGKPLEERRKRVQAWISTLKIAEERVFAVLGVDGWSDVGEDELMILTGLKTAIQDGDTIDETFPRIESPEAAKSKVPQQPGQKPQEKASKSQEKKAEPPPPTTPPQPKETEPTDAEIEAAMGLAPAPAPAPALQPEPAAAATPQPAPSADPKLAPKSGDSDALAEVKFLAARDGLTYDTLMNWARQNKVAKDNQQLADLAEAKLLKIAANWSVLLPKVREFAPK